MPPKSQRQKKNPEFTPRRKYTGPSDLPDYVSVVDDQFVLSPDAPPPAHESCDSMFDGRMHRTPDYIDKDNEASGGDKEACTLRRNVCLQKFCYKAGSTATIYVGEVPDKQQLMTFTKHPTKYDYDQKTWVADSPFIREVLLSRMDAELKRGIDVAGYQCDKPALLMPVLSAQEAVDWVNKKKRLEIESTFTNPKKFMLRKWVVIDGAHRRGYILSPECKSEWPGYYFMVLHPDCPFNVLYYLAHSGNSTDVNSSTKTSFLSKVGQARIAFLGGVSATKLYTLVDHSWGMRTSVFDAYAVGKLAQNPATWAVLKGDEGRATALWPPVFWKTPLLDKCGEWLDKLLHFVADAVSSPPAIPEGTVEVAVVGKGRSKAKVPVASISGGPITLRGAWGGKKHELKNVLVAATYLLDQVDSSLALDAAGQAAFPFSKEIIPPKTSRVSKQKKDAAEKKWSDFVDAVVEARTSLASDEAYHHHLADAAKCVRNHLPADFNIAWYQEYGTQSKAADLGQLVSELVPRCRCGQRCGRSVLHRRSRRSPSAGKAYAWRATRCC
jgi:hypothetical protein